MADLRNRREERYGGLKPRGRDKMIEEYYRNICAGEQVRANLIALRDALKEERNRRALAYLLGGDFSILCGLLKHDDPKVRRNAALILGKMESEDLLPVLFAAYEKEETKYVRAEYLKAMADMDCRPVLGRLENRLEQLRVMDVSKEDRKHVSEEIRMLQTLVMKYRKTRHHKFAGYRERMEMILVTNRCQREVTAHQIEKGQITMLAGGIRIRDARIRDILPIRTYSELLFPLETEMLSVSDPESVGRAVAGPLLELAGTLHEGQGPFLFRIELKSKMEPEKKGTYIRKISDALELESGGEMVNSVADYELELRLLEKKDDTFAAMVKLFTIPEKRFAYRREHVASSISPVNAALTVELARPYLKENAQVLDPFCGVGTMLIERNEAVKAGVMYGIDIYGDAIEKAHNNTDRAGCRIYYINKDFFDFQHEYLFDEVITDMPQVTAGKQRAEIRSLYFDFFAKVKMHLRDEAVLVLYTTEPQLAKEASASVTGYRIEKTYTLNERNKTAVLVILWRNT